MTNAMSGAASRSRGEQLAVATIDANAGGTNHQGAIAREGDRYVISVDGRPVAQAGSLEGAAGRLASALRRGLPHQRAEDWGVAAHCLVRPDVGLVFGNRSAGGGGGGGGTINPCVARIIAEYRQGADNLERALEFAARLIASCCGGS